MREIIGTIRARLRALGLKSMAKLNDTDLVLRSAPGASGCARQRQTAPSTVSGRPQAVFRRAAPAVAADVGLLDTPMRMAM